MGDVVDFRRGNPDEVADEILVALCAHGSAYQDQETLRVTPAAWRAIARRVGRQLKRPIRTMVSDHAVHAVLTDWPRGPREQAITDRAMRDAVETLTTSCAGHSRLPTESQPR